MSLLCLKNFYEYMFILSDTKISDIFKFYVFFKKKVEIYYFKNVNNQFR